MLLDASVVELLVKELNVLILDHAPLACLPTLSVYCAFLLLYEPVEVLVFVLSEQPNVGKLRQAT